MGYEYFTHADIPAFLELASKEGWISFRWELEYFLRNFPAGCFVFREEGVPLAFVTSIKYDKSGWIGNLIVSEKMRGRGVGTALMKMALAALRTAGTETVWLTASRSGKPIYERLGFVELDVIKRWRGKGCGGGAGPLCEISVEDACLLDGSGWGDRRDILIDAALGRGEMLAMADGFIIIQHCGEFRQIGPWAASRREGSLRLFDIALSRVDKAVDVVLDTPGKNPAVDLLLSSRNFECVGMTCLMYAGTRPAYDPASIYSLSSMGSMG